MPVRQAPRTGRQRIAAGEVVERPASVVKELVENAIDAGASRIDVFTDGGGRRRIGVNRRRQRHDPCGSGARGRPPCHLETRRRGICCGFAPLGFRGEALPSIGAVAKLGITTRHAGEPHAWSPQR